MTYIIKSNQNKILGVTEVYKNYPTVYSTTAKLTTETKIINLKIK